MEPPPDAWPRQAAGAPHYRVAILRRLYPGCDLTVIVSTAYCTNAITATARLSLARGAPEPNPHQRGFRRSVHGSHSTCPPFRSKAVCRRSRASSAWTTRAGPGSEALNFVAVATMLRTDVLALVLLRQLHASGPCPERDALEVLNIGAPGRSHEILDTAMQRGM